MRDTLSTARRISNTRAKETASLATLVDKCDSCLVMFEVLHDCPELSAAEALHDVPQFFRHRPLCTQIVAMICQTRRYLATVPTARDYGKAVRKASTAVQVIKSNLARLMETSKLCGDYYDEELL